MGHVGGLPHGKNATLAAGLPSVRLATNVSGFRKRPETRDVTVPRTVTPDGGPRRHPLGTPAGLSPHGVLAVGAWLAERGIHPPSDKSWRVQVDIDNEVHNRVFAETIDTRFQITIHPDHWGYCFSHAGRVSRVRVTDMPHVDGRDEHQLVGATPPLKRVGSLVRHVEQRYGVFLLRHQASIETTLPGSEPIIRAWVATL